MFARALNKTHLLKAVTQTSKAFMSLVLSFIPISSLAKVFDYRNEASA